MNEPVYHGWTPNVSPKPATKAQLIALRDLLLEKCAKSAAAAIDNAIDMISTVAVEEMLDSNSTRNPSGGEINETPCPQCGGRGSIVTYTINRTNLTTCPDCHGDGVVPDDGGEIKETPPKCWRCKGRGWAVPYNEAGVLALEIEETYPKYTCPVCHGLGYITDEEAEAHAAQEQERDILDLRGGL